MKYLIEKIEIKGFRGLQELKLEKLGRVNLVTGKNNAGKSSLLEAIRILVSGGSLSTIMSILRYREEGRVGRDSFGDVRSRGVLDFRDFRALFTGFPDISLALAGFSISSEGVIPSGIAKVEVYPGYAVRSESQDGATIRYDVVAPSDADDFDATPAFRIVTTGRDRVVPLNRRSWIGTKVSMQLELSPEQIGGVELVYLDPFSSRTTANLGALWDRVALTDAQDEIVKALKLVSPDIQAVSMIGGEGPGGGERTAIVRSDEFSDPVPLRSFGDGVNRLFGIVLSLCNAKNGLLIVDEFENGLHYSVQVDVWKTIFRLARQLNVQVFASSHSWDCVRAFSGAASESPEEGVLTRLTRVGETVIPATFTEEDLKVVTEYDIEVR